MTRARIFAAIGLTLVLVAVVVLIFNKGEKSGADAAAVKSGQQHTAAVAEARTDERGADDVAASIAGSVARSDALTDALVKNTIKDLRDALSAVPAATPGEPLPAAPVDSLRDILNAGIDRANRAAAAASAEP